MEFLVISDIHGNLENLEKLNPMAKKADGIIFAGDFTEFNNETTGLPVLKALCKMNENIFAVRGNCDYPSLEEEFDQLGQRFEALKKSSRQATSAASVSL